MSSARSSPEPVPLYDAQGNVQLPAGLISLCKLRYTRRLRPEAVEIVRAFARTGVRIKVFASDEPDQIRAMLQEAGLRKEDEERLMAASTISGRDLERLPPAEWGRAATENNIFAQVTPAQAGALVRALRESGESVAVVGDGVSDLPALRQADLAIAPQTNAQAALGVADIVMIGNSPRALLQVLYRGQAIVHGLMRRAAVSISSNMAEGSSRSSRPDFARFLEIATGSVFEVVSQATIGRRQGFLSEHAYGQVYAAAEKQSRMLSGLRKSLESP